MGTPFKHRPMHGEAPAAGSSIRNATPLDDEPTDTAHMGQFSQDEDDNVFFVPCPSWDTDQRQYTICSCVHAATHGIENKPPDITAFPAEPFMPSSDDATPNVQGLVSFYATTIAVIVGCSAFATTLYLIRSRVKSEHKKKTKKLRKREAKAKAASTTASTTVDSSGTTEVVSSEESRSREASPSGSSPVEASTLDTQTAQTTQTPQTNESKSCQPKSPGTKPSRDTKETLSSNAPLSSTPDKSHATTSPPLLSISHPVSPSLSASESTSSYSGISGLQTPDTVLQSSQSSEPANALEPSTKAAPSQDDSVNTSVEKTEVLNVTEATVDENSKKQQEESDDADSWTVVSRGRARHSSRNKDTELTDHADGSERLEHMRVKSHSAAPSSSMNHSSHISSPGSMAHITRTSYLSSQLTPKQSPNRRLPSTPSIVTPTSSSYVSKVYSTPPSTKRTLARSAPSADSSAEKPQLVNYNMVAQLSTSHPSALRHQSISAHVRNVGSQEDLHAPHAVSPQPSTSNARQSSPRSASQLSMLLQEPFSDGSVADEQTSWVSRMQPAHPQMPGASGTADPRDMAATIDRQTHELEIVYWRLSVVENDLRTAMDDAQHIIDTLLHRTHAAEDQVRSLGAEPVTTSESPVRTELRLAPPVTDRCVRCGMRFSDNLVDKEPDVSDGVLST